LNEAILEAVILALSQIYSDRYGVKVTVRIK
jgi:hypothetical protein